MKKFYEQIFGTPIWVIKECDSKITHDMYDWAIDLQTKDKGIKVSNRGGYHSHYYNKFEDILNLDYLQSKLNFLPPFWFCDWWINIQNKGDYTQIHTHPLSDLSVIWYFTHNDNSLIFSDPIKEHMRINLYNAFKKANHRHFQRDEFSYNWKWELDAGDIIVFPSDMSHHTEPYTGNTPRICLSANIRMKY